MKRLFMAVIAATMLLGAQLAVAQGQVGGNVPQQPPPAGAQPPRPLHPIQEQQKAAQQAQLAQMRQNAPDFVLNGAYNGPATAGPNGSPEQQRAVAIARAAQARRAAGDMSPPNADELSIAGNYSATNGVGPRRQRQRPRGEVPSPEDALHLLGLGALADLKALVDYDGMPDRVLPAPDEQTISIPIGTCDLSSYIFTNNNNAWNLPVLYGIGFQYCNVDPSQVYWQSQQIYLMKCTWYFWVWNLCLSPQYYWYYNPPGECVNFSADNFACGPGRYYPWEDGVYIVRDWGSIDVVNGYGSGFKDSTPLDFHMNPY